MAFRLMVPPIMDASLVLELALLQQSPVGYVRVSSFEQNESQQLEGLELDRVFLDKASGKNIQRPQLEALMKFVREGDLVVCHSMDRLGRNLWTCGKQLGN